MHPGLNLTNLKFFYDAADSKSVSQAARRNFVTQSAISQGIQKLEKALGVELTTHQRHHFKLTAEGEVVYVRAQLVFKALREMQDDLQANANCVKGPVHFLCPQSIAMSFILPSIKISQETLPDVSLHFHVATIETIHASLRQRGVDFGIVIDCEEFKTYDKRILYEGYFHIYAKSSKIENGVLVDKKEGLHVETFKTLYLKKYRKELKIPFYLDSWEVVAHFVDNGMACGFFPDYLVANDRYPGIRPVATKIPPIPYKIVAIYPKGDKLSRAASAYLDCFKTCLDVTAIHSD